MYSARAQDGPQDMERKQAAARHSWARQHAWMLLSFFPFPVGHPEHEHCTATEACETLRIGIKSDRKIE